MSRRLRPARLSAGDVVRVGAAGLFARPLRVVLSALGIAIGIASILAVVGVSASSAAQLDRVLARLGTNLLVVAPGETLNGDSAKLPTAAVAMINRIGPVQQAAGTGTIDAGVYRNEKIPSGQTGALAVVATQLNLPPVLGATVSRGDWLNAATARYPGVVLGATAAARLGIREPGPRVWIDGRYTTGEWFGVVGILAPVPLVPELDSAALVGWTSARTTLGFDGHPTAIYSRSVDSQVEAVHGVLGATANPAAPGAVRVSRPSDALAARRATGRALDELVLGLGALALLVGGVGVANTMVISVLERRAEIGLRRSLGATRGQVARQFLSESLLLSALGGGAGLLVGIAATAIWAGTRGWPVVVPVWAGAAALAATLVTGALAGIYPAIRAARLPPAQAVSSP
jgi:putative ABC transport system permease protein